MDDEELMDTSLDRIRAKIAELEARLESLKIAERELLQLEAPSTRVISTPKALTPKTRVPRASKVQAVEPAAVETGPEEAAPKQTIGAAITDVLSQHGALSASAIAEHVVAAGKDINNRAVSFALQALKKRGLVKTAGGEWSLKKTRRKRGG
jgi:hypothetical protein